MSGGKPGQDLWDLRGGCAAFAADFFLFIPFSEIYSGLRGPYPLRWSPGGLCMNIQIFGSSKSFDTKKAERWFKERRIRVQSVDVRKYGMSLGELTSVRQAVGLEAMVDPKHPDTVLLQYLASDQAKLDKLFQDPALLRTPIVRNGKQATVGYCPEIWVSWS